MKTYPRYKDSGIDWMGEIPNHWTRLRLKDISFMYGGLTGKSGDDFRCDDDTKTKPFVPFTNVLNNTKIDFTQFNRVVMDNDEEQNKVKENDLIFLMSSEDYESIAKTSVVVGDPGEVYLNSFCRGLRFTNKDIHAPFINYQLNSETYRDALRFEARGFTRINIKIDRVNSQFIALPPHEEQQRIADYLDEKCGAIDKNVELLEKKRDSYIRLKASIISHAVTRGINPSAPLRDSGIEEIGQIPSHWNTVHMKRLFSFSKGLTITKADLVETGLPVISYGQIHAKNNPGTRVEEHLLRFVPKSYAEGNESSAVSPGDFIFADTSEDLVGCGNCAYIDKSGIFAGYHSIIVRNDNKNNKFFAYLFLCEEWRNQLRRMVGGIKVFSVTQSILGRTFVVIPPPSEQQAIADYLDSKCGEIDNVIEKIDKQIDAHKRLKKSLINEVVTGRRAV